MKKWEDVVRVPAPAIIPKFGPLSGIRVLTTGSLIAMPHAAGMMADFGAEIIHVERPGVGDTLRGLAPLVDGTSAGWIQDARNRLSFSFELNLKYPESKEIFYGLLKQVDIWMENMVWLGKLGISDEECLKVNPKLVIVHCSGYGHAEFGGLPEYCDGASYDMIGQAFSGVLYMNGFPDRDPVVAKPWTNDYVSGMHTLFSALAGYIHAQKTGEGVIMDVAQFEANARWLSHNFVAYTELGVISERAGNKAGGFQPYDIFQAKDKLVAIGAFGPAVYNRFIKALGLDAEYFNWKDCSSGPAAVSSPKGMELDKYTRDWVASMNAQDVFLHLLKFKVPCGVVNNAEDCVKDPHYNSRNDFIEYEDQSIKRNVKAFGVIPKSTVPGGVWRGAPAMGQDTEAVLSKLLDATPEDIAELKAKKIV